MPTKYVPGYFLFPGKEGCVVSRQDFFFEKVLFPAECFRKERMKLRCQYEPPVVEVGLSSANPQLWWKWNRRGCWALFFPVNIFGQFSVGGSQQRKS